MTLPLRLTKGSQKCFASDVVTANGTKSRKQGKSHKIRTKPWNTLGKSEFGATKKGRGNRETKETEKYSHIQAKGIILRTVC